MSSANNKKFTKYCSKCGELQYYNSKASLNFAIKHNNQCRKCLFSNPNYIEKIRQSNKGQKRSAETKENMRRAFDRNRGTGVYSNKSEKNGMFGVKGKEHPTYNRPHTEEEKLKMRNFRSADFKRKMRLATCKRLKERGCSRGYNQLACLFFDYINSEFDWKGIHARNGGEFFIKELGYYVDYYEPNLNLVIEWDEESHFVANKLKERDLQRQQQIIDQLKCKFIRIRQRNIGELIMNLSEYAMSLLKDLANNNGEVWYARPCPYQGPEQLDIQLGSGGPNLTQGKTILENLKTESSLKELIGSIYLEHNGILGEHQVYTLTMAGWDVNR